MFETKAKDAETKLAEATAPAKVQEKVKARLSLEKQAAPILEGVKLDEMDDLAIKRAVSAKRMPSQKAKFDAASKESVDVAFGLIVETPAGESTAIQGLRASVTQPAGGGETKSDADQAHDEMIKKNQSAVETYRKRHLGVA